MDKMASRVYSRPNLLQFFRIDTPTCHFREVLMSAIFLHPFPIVILVAILYLYITKCNNQD